MRSRAASCETLLLAASLVVLAALPAPAQEAEASPGSAEPGWSGRANLNLAGSYGNAGSGSLGLSAEAGHRSRRMRLAFEAGVLRTSTDSLTRQAFGSPEEFRVERSVTTRRSADRSHFRARVSEPLPEGSAGLSFYAATGWERDVPAGVLSRYDLTIGVGTSWGDEREAGRRPFEIGAGLSAVHQRDEVADPEAGAGSLGLRMDARGETRYRDADLAVVSASTWNLANTDDLRLDVTGSVAYPLSERLAFRTSVQTLFDSRPALERVALFGTPGGPRLGRVAAPRQKTDVILLVSLVVRF